MNEVVERKNNEITTFMTPQNFDQALKIADTLSKSGLVPNDYKKKPEDILVAMAHGAELGMPPISSLQSIAVINGRPSLWGDAVLALVKTKNDYEYIKETYDEKTETATCEAKRKGEPAYLITFSRKEAELAGLWGKNTWKAYPKRMLQMRARSFAIRSVFPHHLKGIAVAEEINDYEPTPAKNITDPLAPAEIIEVQPIIDAEPVISETPTEDDKTKAIEEIFQNFAAINVSENGLLEFFGVENKEDILLEWLKADETREFYKECRDEFRKSGDPLK